MKLAPNTEWIVIAALVLYISFTNGLPIIRDILRTGLGKAVALAAIVYVHKYVSCVVALLLTITFVRCATWSVWEGLETPLSTCTCETGFVYDSTIGKCKNPEGATKDPTACTCPSGYSYDAAKKECIPASVMTPPISPPPSALPMAPEAAAPAVSTGPVTSNAPMTTPGAAQAMAASAPPMTTPPPGPTPTTEKFMSGYSQY